ncbi:argonaute/piwi family protein [Halobacterium rubrum]|uniref:hypothetical protein n=1 Tax=Halobacterium TaxID=2239 RepID=UPI001F2A0FE1|nr:MULTISPECIES: hypothetical protein [Halobacterium]MDH5020340.1 hypothetical protein [Halobacterium rubrum]
MSQFLSSFPVTVPEVPAKVYSISAELPDDPYSELDHYENVLASRTWGNAHRLRGTDGDWHLAVFGHDHEPEELDVDGIKLQLEGDVTLDAENPRHRKALAQALRESFGSFLTSVLNYWEYNEYANFYDDEPHRTVRGDDATYEMYRGVRTNIDYREGSGFMLSADPTRKFLDERTLADRLADQGESEIINRFGGGKRYFFFDRPEPQPVRLHTISDATVSDETMTIDGEPTSVLSFVEEEYGSEYAGKIDPSELIAKVKYSPDGRTYDAAPSLLRLIPNQEEATTQASTLDADERWREVKEWKRPIHYIQLGNHDADVGDAPISNNIDTFDFPTLGFGEDVVLEIGASDLTSSGEITRSNWEYRVLDYLKEFGPKRKPMDEPWVAVLHTDSTRETAFEAFETISDYLETYTGVKLKAHPGGASFESRGEFDEWRNDFADKVTGAFAYMTDDGPYYDVINAVNGKPVQHLRHENYQKERNRDQSYSLRNTATDLASKLGIRPFLLEEGLNADVAIGLSVTGDQQTTACSVTISGETGDVIDWTDRPHGRGNDQVTDHDLAEKLIGDGIVAATEQSDSPINSLVIHRNGTYGNEELAGIESAIEGLKEDGYIDSDFSWSAVELRDSTSYRLYSEDGDRACRTGAYARIDESTILLSPSGGEYTYQGTPRTFQIRRKAGTGDFDIVDVGKDVFDLSFLVWWSPGSKISDPITIRYPSRMHTLFENCPQLRFLPS